MRKKYEWSISSLARNKVRSKKRDTDINPTGWGLCRSLAQVTEKQTGAIRIFIQSPLIKAAKAAKAAKGSKNAKSNRSQKSRGRYADDERLKKYLAGWIICSLYDK